MTFIDPVLAAAVAAKRIPLSADWAPLNGAREAEIREHVAGMTNFSLGNLAARDLLAEVDRLRAELADFSGRVNELESSLCECEPVREHRNFRRPAFYQHAADCPVNGKAGDPR